MPQLDKFTYFTQFFWLCLFFLTFYIAICNDGDGVLGISRIIKLRNQLVSHRDNNIRSNDPKSFEDILRKSLSTGVSYMYSSLFDVSQWCKAVDLLGKRRKKTSFSSFSEISGSRGMERNIFYLINKSEYSTDSNCSEMISYMGGLDGEQKQLIKKLVNFRMKEGKRTRVRAIVYQTYHRLARTERDVIKLMVDARQNIEPICEVKKVGVAGTIYDVPGIVARDRQQTLAIRWILEATFKRHISQRISLEKCLFAEILDAYRKRGIARKKRGNLHGLASTNRSFAHFRWW